MATLDLHIEPAPEGALHKLIRIRWQAGIRVEEKEYVALGLARASVHLRRAAARRNHDSVAESGSELARRVFAAAVDEDHLMAAAAQRRERLQRRADARRLVQRRDDDRESFSDQS
jgi:hypothetical protein